MKITKIEIKRFRGFHGPSVYTFDLPGGKNLLLHGENGSGKSSLYHALNQLFNIDLRKLRLEFGVLAYDKVKHQIQGQALHLWVEFKGGLLTSYQTLLNEPRNKLS